MAGHRKLSHGGGINGFSTMIARYPDDRLAVIVLSNTAGADTPGIETRIAKHILGIEDKPVVDLPIDAALIERVVGKYQTDEGGIEITAEDGKLYARSAGQPKDRLKYQGQERFVLSKNAEMHITFTPPEVKAEGFDIEMQGQKVSAKRAE
jgi:hypothetical protein